LITFAR